jgi:hypothetical protein
MTQQYKVIMIDEYGRQISSEVHDSYEAAIKHKKMLKQRTKNQMIIKPHYSWES